MAQTTTYHAKDMNDTVPEGTAMYFQVRDPTSNIEQYNQWVAFNADQTQWRLDNPNQPDPTLVPHASVADPDNISLAEKLFLQTRFLRYGDDGKVATYPAKWAQLNTTNFPTLDVPGTRAALINIHDTQRVFENLTMI